MSMSDPIRTADADWRAMRTPPGALAEPITLQAHCGAFLLSDRFTAAQARDLGSRLMALALQCEIEHSEDAAEGERIGRQAAENMLSRQFDWAVDRLLKPVAESPAEAA